MLSKKQALTLKFIKDFIKKNNYSPSFREIADQFGNSAVSTIASRIKVLKDKGYLSHQWNRSRSLMPLSQAQKTASKKEKENMIKLPLLKAVRKVFSDSGSRFQVHGSPLKTLGKRQLPKPLNREW